LSLRVRAPSGSERSSAGQSRTGIVGQANGVTADGTTTSACGTIQNYEFNFGDDSPPASGQTVSHMYAAPGIYTVLLTLTDCAGVTATSIGSIIILPDAGTTH